MIYRVGEWMGVVKSECPSALEICDDFACQSWRTKITASPMAKSLMPHQIEAAAFLVSRAGGILADDMGLGKTRSALAAVRADETSSLPAFVVTPAGLRKGWEKEILEFWPNCRFVLADKVSDTEGEHDVVIISYGALKKFVGEDGVGGIGTLIVDEAHSFKNSRAIYGEQRKAYLQRIAEGEDAGVHRTALLFDLAAMARRVYCLTGTPVLSRPKELFNLLKLTGHSLGKNFISFSTRYCGGRQGRFGWVCDGCTNSGELKEKLRNHVLRRHKKTILKLPEKKIEHIHVPLDMSTHFRYSAAWDDYIAMVRQTRTQEEAARVWQARHLVQISLLRQICSESKIPAAVERVKGHSGKVVVFSTYSKTISLLAAELASQNIDCVAYEGNMNERRRGEAVEKFQSDPACRVFIGQTETAKVGLTLTAATLTIFMDLVYTPADHFQAEDRCYRIGQKKPVKIEYLVCPGTVEDHLLEIHDTKKNVISRIFDEDLEDPDDSVSSNISKFLVTRLRGVASSSTQNKDGELPF